MNADPHTTHPSSKRTANTTFSARIAHGSKSDDLVNWEPFTNNLSTQFKDILGDFWEEWPKQPANSDLTGNMWAPDVIYNKAMKKWCMYMSVNGINYKSAIVLLTADDIEGD